MPCSIANYALVLVQFFPDDDRPTLLTLAQACYSCSVPGVLIGECIIDTSSIRNGRLHGTSKPSSTLKWDEQMRRLSFSHGTTR